MNWGNGKYGTFLHSKAWDRPKSLTIMAALELGKRRKLQESKEREQIRCSEDIYKLFHPLMCDLPQEEFWILLLNQHVK